MREGKSVKAYAERYWEMFNEIDGDFDEVAIRTFKVSLPSEHGLRKSLTDKSVTSLRQLMDRIDKYKRIEDDQQQGKGKTKIIPQEMRDFRSDRYSNNRLRRDYVDQSMSNNTHVVSAVFREPMHQVLEKIKNEPFFKRPNKMVGNPKKRSCNLYCQYHQDHRHTTEDCRSLWDHLDQLVREGKSKQLLHHFSGLGGQANSGSQRDIPSRPPLGTNNVMFAAPGKTESCPSKIMFVARLSSGDTSQDPKKARV